jgi:phosphoserine phosphatase
MNQQKKRNIFLVVFIFFWIGIFNVAAHPSDDELPSWRGDENSNKAKILAFIHQSTNPLSPGFVPESLRIAAIDMDGTILCERPHYASMEMALQWLKNAADVDPALRDQYPYNKILSGKHSYKKKYYMDLLFKAFEGYTQEQYMREVQKFLRNHRHAGLERPYVELFYVPVLELIDLLKKNGFRVYVVSGSWQAFVRSIATVQLGLESFQAIGSRVGLRFDINKGKAVFVRQGEELPPANVREGKVLNMWSHIGKIPVLAMGNSRGDLQMFKYTDANPYPHLVLCLEHDDPVREFQYSSGVTYQKDWISVSMKKDFGVVFK